MTPGERGLHVFVRNDSGFDQLRLWHEVIGSTGGIAKDERPPSQVFDGPDAAALPGDDDAVVLGAEARIVHRWLRARADIYADRLGTGDFLGEQIREHTGFH